MIPYFRRFTKRRPDGELRSVASEFTILVRNGPADQVSQDIAMMVLWLGTVLPL